MATTTRLLLLLALLGTESAIGVTPAEPVLDLDSLRSLPQAEAISSLRSASTWATVHPHLGASPDAQLVFCYGPSSPAGASLPQASLLFFRGRLVLADISWQSVSEPSSSLLQSVFALPIAPPPPVPLRHGLSWPHPFGYVFRAVLSHWTDSSALGRSFARVDLSDGATIKQAIDAFFGDRDHAALLSP